MNGFDMTRDKKLRRLIDFRSYENAMQRKYGIKWKRLISVEEETELEKKRNLVDWSKLGIADRK